MKKLIALILSGLLLTGCSFKFNNTPNGGNNNPGDNDPGDQGGEDPVVTKVFPTEQILAFYEEKGVTGVTIPEYKVNSSLILDYSIKEFEYSYFELVIQGDISSLYKQAATKLNYSLYGSDTSVYKDASNKVVFTVAYKSIGNNTVIKYETYDEYAFYMGDIDIEDDGYKYTAVEYTFSVADNMKDYSGQNMDNITVTSDQINYTFKKESANNAPSVYNKNGWHIRFYANTSITVSSENVTLKRLSFIFLPGYEGTVSADSGSVGYNSDETEYVWTGEANTVKFTADVQIRFTDIDVKGVKCEKIIPSTEGVSTVAQVYESIEGYSYTPNAAGWFLTNSTVKLQVKAIDAIDSKSKSASEGYEPNAEGKVLCADATGAILVSSGTTSNNPVSLYHAAKNYMTKGSCYEITGKIAFLNGVPEVMVTSYKYNSALEVNVNLESLVEKTIDTQEELLSDLSSTKINSKGYGTNKIVKMTALSYFNKYKKQGSYLFLDKNSKIIPVYTLEDNARSELAAHDVVDIIGFETLYEGRPSLRVLDVQESTTSTKAEYDFDNSPTNVSNFNEFYQLDASDGDVYKYSGLNVYTAEVYVSQYANDKYTINTNYYYDQAKKCYTTGSSLSNAVSHKSLMLSNESLDYKHLFDGWQIDLCSTVEEVASSKIRIYFTLVEIHTCDSTDYWMVNVIEDKVPAYNAEQE